MHKLEYQFGKSLTLLSINEKDSVNKWSLQGPVKKAFDKTVKGYVYCTDQLSKLVVPQDFRRSSLQLIQPFVILQCKVLDC